MSDTDRIRVLSDRLEEMDRRTVPAWQRPILEVAKEALLQEIASLAQRIARWHQAPMAPALARVR